MDDFGVFLLLLLWRWDVSTVDFEHPWVIVDKLVEFSQYFFRLQCLRVDLADALVLNKLVLFG